ncbi:acylneuraminate cytidylyltransferase [bacterium 1XD42-1]|nr:acylneuraminate cytidylyltransferase [bacterium 1XD42-8]RKJ64601.1 acylneuraminate cytidylyltransferase [bacterium 1XD42-1]
MDNMVNPVSIIVQAHMGSTRLKNKMLKELCGISVLGHVLERLKRAKNVEQIIVATSILPEDEILVKECKKYDIQVYRGSNDDVLERFYQTACRFEVAHIARICADNTLVDWEIIDEEIKIYQQGIYDVVTTGKSVPLGLGCEIFSMDWLTEAYKNATERYQHEHVTPYIYEQTNNVYHYDILQDYSEYRFTLDTQEDWEFLNKIYSELYPQKPDFLLSDVISLINANPDWANINRNVYQKTMYE